MSNECKSIGEAKELICEIGRRMYAKDFVSANDGNISVRIDDNKVVCTPTGVSKGYMKPEMMCLIDMEGNQLGGDLKPSSEMKMHLRVYKENPNMKAVVHAHPPVSTTFSIVGVELKKPILAASIVLLGDIHIAPYAKPGTEEVPESIAPFCNNSNGVLLANHGALTWGKDIFEAYYRLESMEHYAKILMYTTRIFESDKELNEEQIKGLLEIKERLGL